MEGSGKGALATSQPLPHLISTWFHPGGRETSNAAGGRGSFPPTPSSLPFAETRLEDPRSMPKYRSSSVSLPGRSCRIRRTLSSGGQSSHATETTSRPDTASSLPPEPRGAAESAWATGPSPTPFLWPELRAARHASPPIHPTTKAASKRTPRMSTPVLTGTRALARAFPRIPSRLGLSLPCPLVPESPALRALLICSNLRLQRGQVPK